MEERVAPPSCAQPTTRYGSHLQAPLWRLAAPPGQRGSQPAGSPAAQGGSNAAGGPSRPSGGAEAAA
eukprot:15481527-Alexandrium_andersonii.AAC.1